MKDTLCRNSSATQKKYTLMPHQALFYHIKKNSMIVEIISKILMNFIILNKKIYYIKNGY